MKRSLVLGGLAACAFAVTYGLATLLGQSPGKGPPGMVWVPGGEFMMGTDSAPGRPDERPVHRVRVAG